MFERPQHLRAELLPRSRIRSPAGRCRSQDLPSCVHQGVRLAWFSHGQPRFLNFWKPGNGTEFGYYEGKVREIGPTAGKSRDKVRELVESANKANKLIAPFSIAFYAFAINRLLYYLFNVIINTSFFVNIHVACRCLTRSSLGLIKIHIMQHVNFHVACRCLTCTKVWCALIFILCSA